MALYYCINEILDHLEKQDSKNADPLQTLIAVSGETPECGGHPEDVFVLSSSPKMLDLRVSDSASQLAHLINEVPLYNINMELILDQALTERHHNPYIETALNRAFANQSLPNTLKPADIGEEDFSGGLRHPMLGHLNKEELSHIYISFMQALDREKENYGFERSILGKHTERFLEHFDGFVSAEGGKVKASILIAFGMRQDHDPSNPMSAHITNGEKQARKMNIEEPREMIWAWLEADHYQMRRCRDLDRLMQVKDLPKLPNWVKTDIFACLEKEAMKQIFSQSFVQKDPELALLSETKELRQAVKINADGQVSEELQQLLSQTLNQAAPYAGAAAQFAKKAERRQSEAKQNKLG